MRGWIEQPKERITKTQEFYLYAIKKGILMEPNLTNWIESWKLEEIQNKRRIQGEKL